MAHVKTGKFTKGGNPGTAKCIECGQTRQRANGQTPDGVHFVCNPCYDKAGDANAVADGQLTEADFVARYDEPSGYGWVANLGKDA